MPIIKAGPYDVDVAEAGAGPAVLLLHSSAAGNRQWRKLVEERAAQNRLMAVNLFGYGATSNWPNERSMTLDDQVNIVTAVAHFADDPITLIGHSLGGAIACATAHRLGDRLCALIAFEPILFYLLRQMGETEAYAEIDKVRRTYNELAGKNDWDGVGRHFVDYWGGHGAWESMSDERRFRALQLLPPVVHEWAMVGTDGPSIDHWKEIKAPVHILYAADTRLPTRKIAELLRREIPHWHFHEIPTGGHLAPISRPDLVNPVMAKILDAAGKS